MERMTPHPCRWRLQFFSSLEIQSQNLNQLVFLGGCLTLAYSKEHKMNGGRTRDACFRIQLFQKDIRFVICNLEPLKELR
ncbi:uncharacterized protein PRD47_010228 [Ara ararauna]